jgi:hypothetical protein
VSSEISASLLLLMIGAACGIASLFIMRRFSDQAAIRTARARIRAHLYELRLFGDEPVLMLRAQKKLLLWNLRYLKLVFTPAAIIAIPALLLAGQLDALYGKRALRPGEAVLVTATLKPGTAADSIDPALSTAPSFAVESPSVRIPDLRQICWRVRAIGDSDGLLRLALPGEVVLHRIRAGAGLRYIADACRSSMWGLVENGCRIQSRLTESISIGYPAASVVIAGLEAHWAVWFALSWFATMLIVRRRIGVEL